MTESERKLYEKTIAAIEEQVELLHNSGNRLEVEGRQSVIDTLCGVVKVIRT